jgi:ABC-type transport system involved in cytochrome c biogenesis permease subunit
VAGGLVMVSVRGRWEAVAIGARGLALLALTAGLITAATAQGRWTAGDPRQAMLSLAAAMLAVHLVLAWRAGAGSAGPVVDIVALVLSLVSVFAIQPASSDAICIQLPAVVQGQWVLFSLGGGSVLVAGCAGLMLAFRRALSWRGLDLRLPAWLPLVGMLTQGARLSVVVLGGGLIAGVWWSWRMSGRLPSGDARQVWMAVAWLVTAMSLLAWQADGRRSRWAVGLALVAMAAVLVSLLVPAGLSMAAI